LVYWHAVQAEAEYAHLEKFEKAITRHAMPAALVDPSASEHQKATITAALQMEHSVTKKSMMDICHVMMVSTQGWSLF